MKMILCKEQKSKSIQRIILCVNFNEFQHYLMELSPLKWLLLKIELVHRNEMDTTQRIKIVEHDDFKQYAKYQHFVWSVNRVIGLYAYILLKWVYFCGISLKLLQKEYLVKRLNQSK